MVSFKVVQAMFLQICAMYKYCKRRRNKKWRSMPVKSKRGPSLYKQAIYLQMKNMDSKQLFIQTRTSQPVFNQLLQLLIKELRKPKQRILPEERLFVTLLFLAHGTSIQNIAWSNKLGRTTVRNIILETCEVLWRLLSPLCVSEPSEQRYKKIATDFKNMWNMPNCVGAIDGKHIAIKWPTNSSLVNNKKVFSSVLMAVCDAKYIFTSVSVQSCGNENDAGIFKSCPFGEALIANTLPLPKSARLSNVSSETFPHFFVGNTSFPLRANLMRPYPGVNLDKKRRVFNYRLSRARQVIENAFGILTVRWRVLRNTLEFSPENSEKIIYACIALHNFIMLNDHQHWYCPEGFVDYEGPDHVIHEGNWRNEAGSGQQCLKSVVSFDRRAATTAFQLRDKLADFFVNQEDS